MDRIVIVRDGEEEAEFPLEKKTCSIGRDSESDIPLKDPLVSRDHARLTRIYDDYYLEDLESTNGTLLNDRVVTKHILRHGDRLRIGRFDLRFYSRQQASDRPPEGTTAATRSKGSNGLKTESQVNRRKLMPKTARIRFFRGPNKGQWEKIERSLYTIGQPGGEVAVIARRPQGFYLLHIGGDRYPKINSKAINTTKGIQLQEGDILEVGENLAEISFA